MWIPLLIVLLLLSSCSSDNSDLIHYIKQLNNKPELKLNPLPNFNLSPVFQYPEYLQIRNPFTPPAIEKKTSSKQSKAVVWVNNIKRSTFQKKVRAGKKISLNFQKISIKAVLKIFADFTGINIVVSDRVKGNITLRLNEIPWEQAFDIIVTTHGLHVKKSGAVILVDTLSSLNQREDVLLKAKLQLEPLSSIVLQIKYAKAVDLVNLLKDKTNPVLSERGAVNADVRTNTLWIEDTSYKLTEIKHLIEKWDIPVRQVLIEARIVEMTKEMSQDLGIRWGVAKQQPLASIEHSQESLEPSTLFENRFNLDLAAIPANGLIPATAGIALAKLSDTILLDLELSALESEGRAQLISSPKLITTNQQTAVIESGQEIPYQEATSSGATAVAFKKAVLSLKVTPQITPDNKILMELQVNQDTISPAKFLGVPAILTKQIQTNVLVNNGQTLVLGGIYKQDKNKTINRIPLLGELPLIGGIFRSKQKLVKNDELLIFITPKLITNAFQGGEEKQS